MLHSNKKNVLLKSIIIFIFLILISTKVMAMVTPTSDFYVNDYANLLNEETKEYIINTNKSLCSQTGAQIVVVTVPSLDGDSLEDYATTLFRNFGIGDKNKNNGVLLLLALEERKFRVEVGYGLEGILPDGKTGRIQDEYIIPYLKQNNWNDGIKNGYNAILEVVANEYNVEVGAEAPTGTSGSTYNDAEGNKVVFAFFAMPIISYIIGLILYFVRDKKTKKSKTINMFGWLYSLISIIIIKILIEDWGVALFAIPFSIVPFLSGFKGLSGGSGSGGSYHGGRWLFRRRILKWRLFWRRRFFRWWRKLKKFLK